METRANWTERERLIAAAHLFDGEGCVSITKPAPSYPYHNMYCIVGMTHQFYPRWFKELFGGSVTVKAPRGTCGRVWEWRIASTGAARFLKAIAPFSIVKRPQIGVAIRFHATSKREWPLSAETIAERTALYWEMRRFNSPGVQRLSEGTPEEGEAIVQS